MQYSIIPSSEILQGDLSFWQSDTWSRIIIESGQATESFYYGNTRFTFLHIEIRSIGLGLFGAFAIGVSASQIGEDWEAYLSHLRLLLESKGIIFFQIEPIEKIGILRHGATPYKKFLTPYTRTIDLDQTEDEILAQMHEKGRYNIRSAIKKGVQIERATYSQENLDIWMRLLDDTLSRDGFSGNSRKYYETFIMNIEKINQGSLYFARFEDRVIAAAILVYMPTCAVYYYGASSSDSLDKKVFAPYLLQWEIIKIAKNQGAPLYDLLGISEPGVENDSLAGVSFFKSRFGGNIVELPQKIVFAFSWKYSVFFVLQRIKNLLKRR